MCCCVLLLTAIPGRRNIWHRLILGNQLLLLCLGHLCLLLLLQLLCSSSQLLCIFLLCCLLQLLLHVPLQLLADLPQDLIGRLCPVTHPSGCIVIGGDCARRHGACLVLLQLLQAGCCTRHARLSRCDRLRGPWGNRQQRPGTHSVAHRCHLV